MDLDLDLDLDLNLDLDLDPILTPRHSRTSTRSRRVKKREPAAVAR